MNVIKDLHNNILISTAFAPKAAVTDNTAQVSNVLTRALAEIVELIGTLGTMDDVNMTFTLLIEDSADNITFAAVDDAYLLGTEAGVALDFASDGKSFKIGYTGGQKYVRATVTPANNTGNVFLSGVWVESGFRVAPRTTQTR